MVLRLHVWGPALGLPSIDAESLAAITYLAYALPAPGSPEQEKQREPADKPWVLVATSPSAVPTRKWTNPNRLQAKRQGPLPSRAAHSHRRPAASLGRAYCPSSVPSSPPPMMITDVIHLVYLPAVVLSEPVPFISLSLSARHPWVVLKPPSNLKNLILLACPRIDAFFLLWTV